MLTLSKNVFWRWPRVHKKTYFLHLKLEFALAIPPLNEWKIETYNSSAQVLTHIYDQIRGTTLKHLFYRFPINMK